VNHFTTTELVQVAFMSHLQEANFLKPTVNLMLVDTIGWYDIIMIIFNRNMAFNSFQWYY